MNLDQWLVRHGIEVSPQILDQEQVKIKFYTKSTDMATGKQYVEQQTMHQT